MSVLPAFAMLNSTLALPYNISFPLDTLSSMVGTAIWFVCDEHLPICQLPAQLQVIRSTIADPSRWFDLFDFEGFFIYNALYLSCVLAWAVLPGEWKRGEELHTGDHQLYKMN
ncbi:hypothetical protein OF83DRAFT_1087472, partial [Amylostereum chailletii]